VHRAVGVGIVTLGLALAAACEKKTSSTLKIPMTSADAMLARSFDELGTEYFATEISIGYVGPDGTLDPTYGTFEVESSKHPPRPPAPPDDPNRPLGGPTPSTRDIPAHEALANVKCPHFEWRKGQLVILREKSCQPYPLSKMSRPRCSILEILAKAKAAGAPPGGLAKIKFHATFDEPQTWSLKIDDDPRDIHFKHEGKDDCQPVVEKP